VVFCVSDVAIPFSDTMRNIAMLGDRGLSNSDICSSSQGLHEHIQATALPEIYTKINQSINVYVDKPNTQTDGSHQKIAALLKQRDILTYIWE
jgi:hypothetical protein